MASDRAIFYDGLTFLVPDWAVFIAQNKDGSYCIGSGEMKMLAGKWTPIDECDCWEWILPADATSHPMKIK